MKKISFPITVFYDGSCSVCADEIAHYKKKDQHNRLILVDISADGFEPGNYGKTREEFMAQMHVRDNDGLFFLGVDAFPAIWQALPGRFFRILAFVIRLPGIHFMASMAYVLFAKYRGRLFPPPTPCDSGQCGLGHHKQ